MGAPCFTMGHLHVGFIAMLMVLASCTGVRSVASPALSRGSGVNWDEYEAESGATNGEVHIKSCMMYRT